MRSEPRAVMVPPEWRPAGARAVAVLLIALGCGTEPSSNAPPAPPVISGYTLDPTEAVQWVLPMRLREISGLAAGRGGRIFAHDDERAVIYEIDYREGRLVKAFGLGDRTAQDDFEGIAVARDRFYLVSSAGRLYESFEGVDNERMLFNTYGTGAGRHCEVEGLAFEPADRTLVLLCKVARDEALNGYVALYRWSIDERAMARDSLVRIPTAALSRNLPGDSFRPSGIELHPETGNYFIVAAEQQAIAEISRRGEVLAVVAFPPDVHRQPEGITFTRNGELVLADEAAGRGARLTLYPPMPADEGEEGG